MPQLKHSLHEHRATPCRLNAQKWSQSCFLIALFPLSPFLIASGFRVVLALAPTTSRPHRPLHIIIAVHLSGFYLDRTIRARSLLHCCSRAFQWWSSMPPTHIQASWYCIKTAISKQDTLGYGKRHNPSVSRTLWAFFITTNDDKLGCDASSSCTWSSH